MKLGPVAMAAWLLVGAGPAPPGRSVPVPSTLTVRSLRVDALRAGIAYGPHRDGQRPGERPPSREQVREDLRLIAKRWPLIRLYGSAEVAPTVLDVIHEQRLDIGVLLGVSIVAEDRRDSSGRVLATLPQAAADNRREIEAAVTLARHYPTIVRALVVGNETQVFWAAGRVPTPQLIGSIREVRGRVDQPVTTGDDFAYWENPSSRALAAEVDFVMVHLHPLWNGSQLDTAVSWVARHWSAVTAAHSGRTVIIGETGWATRRNDQGDQGKYMKGVLGEAEQARYLADLERWIGQARVPTVVFEAFDENWKGGSDAADVEKHWGVYRADRTPKLAARPVP
jgi:exo-beta-1,3-glucanase (GH17 family)